MNDGLLGGQVGRSLGGALVAVGSAAATVTYAITTESVSDVTVKQDDGTTVMSVTLTTVIAGMAAVRFMARLTKATTTHRTRVSLYDNAVKIAPSTALASNGIYSRYAGENLLQQIAFEFLVPLTAGTHVLDVRHQAALGTSTITWGDRMIVAKVHALH